MTTPTRMVIRESVGGSPGSYRMPADANVIHFGWQEARKAWSIWYEIPSDAVETVLRIFRVAATGEPYEGRAIASAMMPDGFHIFHLIEVQTP